MKLLCAIVVSASLALVNGGFGDGIGINTGKVNVGGSARGKSVAMPTLTHNNEDCEECSFNLDGTVDSLKDIVRKLEPIVVKSGKPCHSCEVRGAAGLHRFGDACSYPDAHNNKQKNHLLGLRWDHMSVVCNCTLAASLPELLNRIKDRLADPFTGSPCKMPPTEVGELEVNAIAKSALSPAALAGLTSCKQVVPGLNKKDTVNGIITIDWHNVTMSMVISHLEGSTPKVNKAKLLSDDFDKIKTKCKGDDDFQGPCKCIVESKFLTAVLMQIVELVFPCYAKQDNDKINELVDMLTCKDDE